VEPIGATAERTGFDSLYFGSRFSRIAPNRSRCFRAHPRRPGEHGGHRDLSDSRESAPRERPDRASHSNPPEHSSPAGHLSERAGTRPFVPRHGFQESRPPQPSDGDSPEGGRARTKKRLRPKNPCQDLRRRARLGAGVKDGRKAQRSHRRIRLHAPSVSF